MKLIKQAESELEVRNIELKKEIQKKKNEYEIQIIQASIENERNINVIDNQFMLAVQQIEASKSRFT